MLLEKYCEAVSAALGEIAGEGAASIDRAAGYVADALAADRLVYIFGCGHSHMLAEEGFYRAGGLAAVSPIFSAPLMLHEDAVQSSRLEKTSGIAAPLLATYPVDKGDVLVCISTSGTNATPVEMALAGREKGMVVIGITASAYFGHPANNPAGLHLHQACDVWVDNRAPYGDASLAIKGAEMPMGPISTITGAFILNAILAQAAGLATQRGVQPPVYRSGNIGGGKEYNAALVQRYAKRIRHLGT